MAREYKDSGIEWIGQIPKEWEVPRLKNVAELHGRIGWNGLRSDEFEENSYAYLVTGQDFKTSEIVWNNCYQIRKERYDEDPFIQLHNGEILVTKDGTIGKIAIVSKMDKPGCLNSGIFVLRQKIDAFAPKYLYWQLYSTLLKTYNDYMNLGGTTIVHLYQNIFERMPLLAPSISEQQKIADYLDKVCGEVDEMVALQETMIEELKAYKQSVITEAVTKGLNPNVPMRDSGIDWIGEIPEHWKVMKIGFIFNNLDYLRKPISAEQRERNNPRYDYYGASGVIDKIDHYNVENKVLLIGEDGANLVMRNLPLVYKAEGRFWVNNHAHILKPKKDDYDYMAHALEAANYRNYITGSAQPKLSQENLQAVKLPVPPISEQRIIASYLDTKCSEIDSLIALKQAKIEELKEYKKSVIYEYVTGKKEVV